MKLIVSTLVTLDGVIQAPGGFGETAQGGWAGSYFTADAAQESYENLLPKGDMPISGACKAADD